MEQQKRLLDKVISKLIERDMVLIGFDEEELYLVKKLRKELSQMQDSFLLVGKDGSTKASWKEPVDPHTIFEIIDVMPMRRKEIRERIG